MTAEAVVGEDWTNLVFEKFRGAGIHGLSVGRLNGGKHKR
jgi:hypothetical protein